MGSATNSCKLANMPASIIAMCGPARGGKSTTIKALAEKLGRCSQIISFADPLRDMARAVGWTGEKNPEQRKIIQNVSEIAKREKGEDVFACSLLSRIEEDTRYVLVDDLRFGIEISTLWKSSHKIIPVALHEEEAEAHWRQAFSDGQDWALHSSELEWRGFRHLIQLQVENSKIDPKRPYEIAEHLSECIK